MHHLLRDIEMMRASASMPFCSKFVPIDGKNYLDGGVADSIPVRKALEMGFDKVIVVLTQPQDYRKKPMNPLMIKAFYRKYPNLCKTLEERHARYNAQADDVAQLEKDPKELERVYNLGLDDGEKTMDALKDYLAR